MLTYPYNIQNIKKKEDINDDFGYGFYVDLEEPNIPYKNMSSLSKYYYKGQKYSKYINLPTICEETIPSISIDLKETNINIIKQQNNAIYYIERILIILFIFINIKLFFL